MPTRDKRIDAYIAKAADYAKPILKQLREVVHEGCPEVEETIKWSMPAFEYKGPFVGMAAFKQHAVFGFWKHKLVVGADRRAETAMGSFGCIKSMADLPPRKTLVALVKKAKKLNDEGVKVVRDKTTRNKQRAAMHPELKAALAKSKQAQATFAAFPPSAQYEYVEWVAEAKTDDTRERRVAQSVDWLAQGKRRHWKYRSA
jgi:uncharacterized protein YdeI (YjbR/CyaY-like superfamily)